MNILHTISCVLTMALILGKAHTMAVIFIFGAHGMDIHMTLEQAEGFYEVHSKQPFFNDLHNIFFTENFLIF